MFGQDRFDAAFVIVAFFIQIVLMVHFAMRKWATITVPWGTAVYLLLGLSGLALGVALVIGKKPWYFWLAGFLCAAWALYGYIVDIAQPVAWRPVEWSSSPHWPTLIPYIVLYLATQMFYWWPLLRISRPLWVVYTVLYIINTWLNISSH